MLLLVLEWNLSPIQESARPPQAWINTRAISLSAQTKICGFGCMPTVSWRLGLQSSNLVCSFEARNNPNTAPLATWFNGGPGCSSMIGLFQENGPCRFENGESTPSLNPYSWNNYANMLYIDQPIGVGFSYGTDPVTSTLTAAPYVWKLIQAFYDQFPKYESREFGIWTESYGGRMCYKPSSYERLDWLTTRLWTCICWLLRWTKCCHIVWLGFWP